MRQKLDFVAGKVDGSTRLKTICFAMALSFFVTCQPLVLSQESISSTIAAPAPALKDKATTNKPAIPKIASDRHGAERSRTSRASDHNFNRSEVEAAEEFVQMKATVYADLNRLEDAKDSEPISKPHRVGKPMMASARSQTVKRASGGAIAELPVQANRKVQAELFKSMGSSNP